MELSNEQIRLLLHFQWKLDLNASAAARRICEAYGEGVVAERTSRKWFAKFKAEDEDLEDQPRSGRPIEVDQQAVLEATPSLTTRMLADDFECNQSTEKWQEVIEVDGEYFD